MSYQHWKTELDTNEIFWAHFDKENSDVNTIDQKVLQELEDIVSEVESSSAKALIIASAKKSGFIAGADIEQFQKIEDADDGFELIRYGQEVFNQIDAMSKPSIALVTGFCVGGGMELVLACRYRIADNNPKVRLGLPEVMLGIHPGWGGTVRLPKLIGALQAMPLILTGRTVDARRAKRLGIVDFAVPKRQLMSTVAYIIQHLPKPHRPGFLARMSNQKLVRKCLAPMMRKQVAAKASQAHYPAPYAAIDQWESYGVSFDAYEHEARSIAKLFMTSTAQNLIRVFFLQTKMKALAKDAKHRFSHVHVIGAGTMGGDIAAWCALNGLKVTLQDQELHCIAPAIKRAAKLYKKKLKKPHLIQQALDRLVPDVKGDGIAAADIIIEAIYENVEAKKKLFKEVENKAKTDAVFATNTSSIPLDEINQVLDAPERLVGIHFFNPVAMMQLVEVVKGEKTSDAVLEKAICFVKQVKRLPMPVKSSPGFLVNRVLMPYLMEAVLLLDQGVSKDIIDKAAKDFGMPMGPVELADTVGLDVCLSVAEELMKHFGGSIPECLKTKVANGELGKKSGKGFYHYKSGKIQRTKGKVMVDLDIQQRLIAKMVDEAKRCLVEQVVEDADLLDAGMIFGTGFAPFRGGPMHYSES